MTLLITSCGLFKPSVIRTNNEPMFCEEAGTEKRPPLLNPPSTKADSDFHAWAGVLYRDYLKLYKGDAILLNCWDREQAKRRQ